MNRDHFFKQIELQFEVHSVCGLLGPRQVGKTTLAKQLLATYKSVHFFDLENPMDLARLKDPMLTLSNITSDLIVIDEVQHKPELFQILRVLVDEKPRKFLILGSASRDLLRQSSESLAGRIGYVELPPFSGFETQEYQNLWLRGGFPKSYLADTNEQSVRWRDGYIRTFMEQDIPNLGFNIPPVLMRRLWMMLANCHGGILNYSDISTSLMISQHTVRKYTEILVGTFMVRLLQPWFENISKRQVKSPKVYIRDSGLLHRLLGIDDWQALQMFPRLGASWEGFALEEIIKVNRVDAEDCYFWKTQNGAELDLLIIKNGKRIGFEIKYTDSPKLTPSMHIAMEDLKLDHLYVIHPHAVSFPLTEKITAVGLVLLTKVV